jgi:hypothetical protein
LHLKQKKFSLTFLVRRFSPPLSTFEGFKGGDLDLEIVDDFEVDFELDFEVDFELDFELDFEVDFKDEVDFKETWGFEIFEVFLEEW